MVLGLRAEAITAMDTAAITVVAFGEVNDQSLAHVLQSSQSLGLALILS